MHQENQAELHIHEWLAVVTIIGFIGMLAVCAYLMSPPLALQTGQPHYLIDNTVEVFVQGSVQFPGPRRVPRGSTIQDVLEVAKPLPQANTGRLNLQAKVRTNQVIKVPAKKVKG